MHHTVELTEENHLDANISLNPNKIKLVHHRCHNLIHEKLAYTQKQVFIVYGAPLSGKSKYVKEISNIGDFIVDIDNIWQCVSGCERYIKPNRLTSVVFSVRDNLIESIRYRRGKWINAYIIGGFLMSELNLEYLGIANPQKRRTEEFIVNSIINWLSIEQDKKMGTI